MTEFSESFVIVYDNIKVIKFDNKEKGKHFLIQIFV